MSFDLRGLLARHRDELSQLHAEHVNRPYVQVLQILGYDRKYVRGEGAYLFDANNRRYLDCLSGYGAFGCGRNHPVIRQAIQDAMDANLPNMLGMGVPQLSGLLARELISVAPAGLDTVFFGNSGSEAVEASLKYARNATNRARIVHCQRGYHGITYGALSVNGNAEFREGFGPMLEQISAVPFNDLEALERELSSKDVAGFIVEPIQGMGVVMPDDDYLPGVAELCRKYGTVFICDEIQTGLGRTGKMFACEHWNVEPDILLVAKALSGGYVPVSGVLSKRWIHDRVYSRLDRCVVHSSTYGDNDLAMTAGLATLHVLREEKLVENAAKQGEWLIKHLQGLTGQYEMLTDVRGKGLMIGIEFSAPRSLSLKMGWNMLHAIDASLFCQAMLIPLLEDHSILAQVAGHELDVLKLLPTLVMSDEDTQGLARSLEGVIASCHRFPGPIWEIGKRMTKQALSRTS